MNPTCGPKCKLCLQSSAHRGTQIISSRGILKFSGPKIICSRVLPQGTALETDALRIALIPVAGHQPHFDKRAEAEIAEEFQSRFLSYFLRNSSGVQIPSFDVSQFSLPVQDLARAFGVAIVGDGELQQKILPLLSVQDEEIRADRASAFDSIVLEALLSFIHEDGWTKVRIDKLAEKVSAIYKGRGFDRGSVGRKCRVGSEAVGHPEWKDQPGRQRDHAERLDLPTGSQARGVPRRARNAGWILQRLSLLSRARGYVCAGQDSSGGCGGCGGFLEKVGGLDMSIRDFGTLAQQWRDLEATGIPLGPLENRVGIDARSSGRVLTIGLGLTTPGGVRFVSSRTVALDTFSRFSSDTIVPGKPASVTAGSRRRGTIQPSNGSSIRRTRDNILGGTPSPQTQNSSRASR